MKNLSIMLCLTAIFCLSSCKNAKEKVFDFSGEWAEQTAERIVATFTQDGDCYKVKVGWREEGLAQYEEWYMKLDKTDADILSYTEGIYLVRQFVNEGDTEAQVDTVYTNGSGRFYLNADSLLVWEDNMAENQEPTLFIRSCFTTEE